MKTPNSLSFENFNHPNDPSYFDINPMGHKETSSNDLDDVKAQMVNKYGNTPENSREAIMDTVERVAEYSDNAKQLYHYLIDLDDDDMDRLILKLETDPENYLLDAMFQMFDI